MVNKERYMGMEVKYKVKNEKYKVMRKIQG